MNTPGVPATGNGALELPPFSLDVQALDLGNEVKAVGLELVETENREPVRGKDGAEIWSEVFPGLAGKDPYVVDFFSPALKSCGNSSSASRAKPLASAPEAPRRPPTARSKVIFPGAD